MPPSIDVVGFADELRAHREAARRSTFELFQRLLDRLPAEAAVDWRALSASVEELVAELGETEARLRATTDALRDARMHLETEAFRYGALFERAPCAYVVTSDTTRIARANQAACALLGRQRADLVGKPLAVYVPLDESRRFRQAVRRTLAADRTECWPVRLTPARTESIECFAHVRPVRDECGGVRLYWHLTEEPRAEDLF